MPPRLVKHTKMHDPGPGKSVKRGLYKEIKMDACYLKAYGKSYASYSLLPHALQKVGATKEGKTASSEQEKYSSWINTMFESRHVTMEHVMEQIASNLACIKRGRRRHPPKHEGGSCATPPAWWSSRESIQAHENE
eukprot:1147215-Pelagomonas_calceolata.AAC.3